MMQADNKHGLLPVNVQRDENAALGAAWRRCVAARPPEWFNGPTLSGYDLSGGGREYIAWIEGPAPTYHRRPRLRGEGDTATEALTALAEQLDMVRSDGLSDLS